jgi:hypothetical protein
MISSPLWYKDQYKDMDGKSAVEQRLEPLIKTSIQLRPKLWVRFWSRLDVTALRTVKETLSICHLATIRTPGGR